MAVIKKRITTTVEEDYSSGTSFGDDSLLQNGSATTFGQLDHSSDQKIEGSSSNVVERPQSSLGDVAHYFSRNWAIVTTVFGVFIAGMFYVARTDVRLDNVVDDVKTLSKKIDYLIVNVTTLQAKVDLWDPKKKK